MGNRIEIGKAEAGQQILRFLERRLSCPRSLIYRWLRNGEVRVNGGRSKPDRVLEYGDVLRLPPQAAGMGENYAPGADKALGKDVCDITQEAIGAELRIVFQDSSLLVLDKPFGLPAQGGTGHADSVASRLKEACSGRYVPAPAHRLDLHASGLILCGKTHRRQSALHNLFRAADSALEREYLCWVRGDASKMFPQSVLCTDMLAENRCSDGRERMEISSNGKETKTYFKCLKVLLHEKYGSVSLVKARLLTGRKHQIRVQLASRFLPLLGDGRYGGPTGLNMMLHACRLRLPGLAPEGGEFISVPRWDGFFAVGDDDVKNVI